MMGRPSRIALQIMIDQHGLGDTIEALQLENDDIFRVLLPTRLAPMPGLLDLLEALERAEIPKAIAHEQPAKFRDQRAGAIPAWPAV
jgi:hypothetical protein